MSAEEKILLKTYKKFSFVELPSDGKSLVWMAKEQTFLERNQQSAIGKLYTLRVQLSVLFGKDFNHVRSKPCFCGLKQSCLLE